MNTGFENFVLSAFRKFLSASNKFGEFSESLVVSGKSNAILAFKKAKYIVRKAHATVRHHARQAAEMAEHAIQKAKEHARRAEKIAREFAEKLAKWYLGDDEKDESEHGDSDEEEEVPLYDEYPFRNLEEPVCHVGKDEFIRRSPLSIYGTPVVLRDGHLQPFTPVLIKQKKLVDEQSLTLFVSLCVALVFVFMYLVFLWRKIKNTINNYESEKLLSVCELSNLSSNDSSIDRIEALLNDQINRGFTLVEHEKVKDLLIIKKKLSEILKKCLLPESIKQTRESIEKLEQDITNDVLYWYSIKELIEEKDNVFLKKYCSQQIELLTQKEDEYNIAICVLSFVKRYQDDPTHKTNLGQLINVLGNIKELKAVASNLSPNFDSIIKQGFHFAASISKLEADKYNLCAIQADSQDSVELKMITSSSDEFKAPSEHSSDESDPPSPKSASSSRSISRRSSYPISPQGSTPSVIMANQTILSTPMAVWNRMEKEGRICDYIMHKEKLNLHSSIAAIDSSIRVSNSEQRKSESKELFELRREKIRDNKVKINISKEIENRKKELFEAHRAEADVKNERLLYEKDIAHVFNSILMEVGVYVLLSIHFLYESMKCGVCDRFKMFPFRYIPWDISEFCKSYLWVAVFPFVQVFVLLLLKANPYLNASILGFFVFALWGRLNDLKYLIFVMMIQYICAVFIMPMIKKTNRNSRHRFGLTCIFLAITFCVFFFSICKGEDGPLSCFYLIKTSGSFIFW